MMKSMSRWLCVAAAAALFGGCQTVRDARNVQNSPQGVVGEYTPKAADFGLSPDKEFSLEQLEEIALQVHPSIRTAENNADSAYLAVKRVQAGFLPTIGTGVSHSRQTNNVNRHHQGFSHTGHWNAYVNLDLMIYDFGKTENETKALIENYRAALLELENTRNDVIYNVRAAFFALNRAIELDNVAKQTIEQYKQHRDHVKEKREVGKGTAYDMTKAEVDVYNAILEETRTRSNIDIAWAKLISTLGFAEPIRFKVTMSNLHEYELEPAALLKRAMVQNPTLKALSAREAAAYKSVDKAISDLYPTLSISLSGNANHRDPSLPWLWNITGAASLVQNLFNGNRNMIAIKDATLNLRNARASRTAYEQSLYLQLHTAVLNAKLAQEQFTVVQEVKKQSQEYYEIVNNQYQVGKSSALERTDAQVALTKAEAEVVTAKFDYQDALAALAKLLGEPVAEPPEEKDTALLF